MAQIPDLKTLWNIADLNGFSLELISMQFPNHIEMHLLLHYEQRDAGTLLGDDFDAQLEALSEAGIPDEAIRFVYGGLRAIAA